MTYGKNVVHDAKLRYKAARLLEKGIGSKMLATELGIPHDTARQWVRMYGAGGGNAILNAGARHRVYPLELSVAAAQDRVDNGLTLREVMAKYGIMSESTLKTWCKKYRAGGAEALVKKPRGRKPRKAENDDGD